MNFAEPSMMFLFALVPLYWLLVWHRRQRRGRLLSSLLAPEMQPKLVSAVSSRRQLLKLVLLTSALALIAFAAMRPRAGVRVEKVETAGMDLCVAIDTSRSMMATDLAPNRLQVAKREIRRLLEGLKGDRIALVAFAGGAILECPLTNDYSAAELFLDVIDDSLVPIGGTAIGSAIRLARDKVFSMPEGDKVLILLTDGEDTTDSDVLGAARDAAAAGIRIYTIGIGSIGGSPVPAESGKPGEYRKNSAGEIVLSKLDVSLLEQIAEITRGRYYHVEAGGTTLSAVLEEISGLEGKRVEERTATVYDERYSFPLGVAIVLLSIEAILGWQAPRRSAWRGRFQ